jgi:hypothetical protein
MNTSLNAKIKDIDSKFFNGLLRKLNLIRWKYKSYFTRKPLIRYWLQKPYIKKLPNNFTSKFEVIFNLGQKNCLGRLFDKYGSVRCHWPSIEDECIKTGCYYHAYDLLFSLYNSQVKILLECGIGSKKKSIPYNMAAAEQSILGGGGARMA